MATPTEDATLGKSFAETVNVDIDNVAAAVSSAEAHASPPGAHAASSIHHTDTDEQNNEILKAANSAASTPKSTSKVSASFKIPSTTRSGLIRKDPLPKRPRKTSTKLKSKSNNKSEQHVTWQTVFSAPSTTTTNSSTNTQLMTSQLSGLTIGTSHISNQQTLMPPLHNGFSLITPGSAMSQNRSIPNIFNTNNTTGNANGTHQTAQPHNGGFGNSMISSSDKRILSTANIQMSQQNSTAHTDAYIFGAPNTANNREVTATGRILNNNPYTFDDINTTSSRHANIGDVTTNNNFHNPILFNRNLRLTQNTLPTFQHQSCTFPPVHNSSQNNSFNFPDSQYHSNSTNFNPYHNSSSLPQQSISFVPNNSHIPFTSSFPNLGNNTADITLSTSHIAARNAISKDLPIFSGKPEDWPIFITNYMQSTERCGFSDQENLIRLQKCLRGPALDAVKGKLMMPSTVKFAIDTLRMLYGRPEVIQQALQKNLRNEPPVRKERLDTLINFALAVQNYRTTMQAIGLSDFLNDPMLLHELVEKLPSDLKLDWGKHRISELKADIVTFDNWLFSLASCASQVTSFIPYVGETKNSKKERILVHDVIDGNKSNNQLSCFKCQNNHFLYECPDFTSLSVNNRRNFIRSNNLCLRCFKRHHIKRCRSKRQCGVDNCKMPHNSLLHKSNENKTNNVQKEDANDDNTHQVLFHSKEKVLFKYIPVTLFGNDCSLNTYALIDEGASCSLIESEVAEQLGLDGPADELCLQWTGEITQKVENSKILSMYISDRKQSSKILMNNVRTVTKLELPVQTLSKAQIDKCEHLKNLPIIPYTSERAKIIIGLDNAKLCVPLEVRENGDELIATRCRIGWGVYGRQQIGDTLCHRILHICTCNNYNKLDEMLKNFFSLDAVGISQTNNQLRSKEDERAKAIMENTTRYLEHEKRWETGLLWKEDEVNLPSSFSMAKRRLICIESKMQRDPELKTFLIEKIQQYVKNGYVRKLKPSEIRNDSKSWFIPLFTVRNKNKNKTRIVWDAAASTENVSLNSFLLKGPDLLKSLVGILIRFRERNIAICGDIREMFHQIRLKKDEQCFQQFLWRDGDPSKNIDVYVMTVLTFGASCSPSLANYVKNRNAERFVDKHPQAVQAILQNTFVDDWLQSVDSEGEMLELAKAVRDIHQCGGFEMRNWLSNSKIVLENLENNDTTNNKIFDRLENSFEKVLGMWWEPTDDELSFFEKFNKEIFNESVPPTKRGILRIVMTIFDPLGLLGHFVIYAKILLQDIWRSRVGWDEPIQRAESDKWWNWVKVLPKMSSIRIPRCYPLANKAEKLELHIFVDASIDAYSAAAYFRAEFAGDTKCSLVASKTRVAPLKPISVPKMELMAAILGLRLCKFICNEASLNITRKIYWSDSKDVLYWIRSDARKFQQFVAVRIGEILEDSNVEDWRWVPSLQNVADDATKWSSIPDIDVTSRWFVGPEILRNTEDKWPQSEFGKNNPSEILYHISNKQPKPKFLCISPDPTRFSTFERLRRCQMAVLEFIRKLLCAEKISTTFKPFLENNDLNASEFLIFRTCQEQVYYEEILQIKNERGLCKSSTLYKLSPFLDKFGMLRINGRIDAATIVPTSIKNPIILPQKHATTNLVIDYYHRKFHHQHNEIVVNEIRQVFWISGLRSAVRKIAKLCQHCKIRKAMPQAPVMGSLPAERLAAFTRPFYNTGIDYFGPIDIVVGRRKEKRWGVVFTCMTVRAVHIEIAASLSTDSFLLVFKQFVCRRGTPRKVFSDNATNFRGASRVLLEEVERISSSEVERKFPNIEWVFIPPSSPHMGGAWERMVRSIKSILMEILPNRGLREEHLRAGLADVEFTLNSRPLTYVPLDSPLGEALTPNHFLIGSSNGIRELSTSLKTGSALSKHFRMTNMISNEFWKRWVRECLPCLTRRTKWYDDSTQHINIGDVVIIVDSEAKRNEWLKGIVIDVHRGKDGVVRSAVVKTVNGLSTRPVVKLAKLDVEK
ncbi:uncharacterized protein LOC142239729 [Haematobia irritans]|uniref:uncharacterized protein LOC142239729 n=1 Tax=Haematobia irritans TaxID=7368 RepID=UPI003F50CE23